MSADAANFAVSRDDAFDKEPLVSAVPSAVVSSAARALTALWEMRMRISSSLEQPALMPKR
jgi:hypothetical protein